MELHCSIKVVRAGEKNNTAAAAAAYISCNRTVGYDGKVNDYTNKPGFVAGNILLPDEAPERWCSDPSAIWAEQDYLDYEKSTRRGPNSELYRAGDIGLPWDLSDEQCIGVMNEVGELMRQKGMVVQWAIHDVVEDGVRNRHGHIMFSMRSCSSEGFGKKNREWNKYNGGLNIPEYLRPKVAEILNRELEIASSDERIEHKSFVERDVDRIPQRHIGTAATAMERKGIKTDRGNKKRYIDWLNHIHAENLRQVEEQAPTKNLDDLIAKARKQQDGNEAFKDWDALFAILRDTRRCRAAFKGELNRVEKLITACEEGNTGYLKWAGCNPEHPGLKEFLQKNQADLHIRIAKLDATENFLLDSKELIKLHNRVVYTSKKVEWDKIYLERNEYRFQYLKGRLDRLNDYMVHLEMSLSWMDILLNTQKFQQYQKTMAKLNEQKSELWRQYYQTKADIKQQKVNLKEHKRDLKAAKKEHKRNKFEL